MRRSDSTGGQERPVHDVRMHQNRGELRQQSAQSGSRQIRDHRHHRRREGGRHRRQRLHHALRRQRRLWETSAEGEVQEPVRERTDRPLPAGDAGSGRTLEDQSGARRQRHFVRMVPGVRGGHQHRQLGDHHLRLRKVAGQK